MKKRFWTIPARRVTKCGECPHVFGIWCGKDGGIEHTPLRGIPSWCPMIGRKK